MKKRDFRKAFPPELLEYFREQGRKGGKIGGKARADKLAPEQRSEIARKAVAAREAKRAAAKSAEVPSKAIAKKRVGTKANV